MRSVSILPSHEAFLSEVLRIHPGFNEWQPKIPSGFIVRLGIPDIRHPLDWDTQQSREFENPLRLPQLAFRKIAGFVSSNNVWDVVDHRAISKYILIEILFNELTPCRCNNREIVLGVKARQHYVSISE